MAWSDDYHCDLRLVSEVDNFLISVASERVVGPVPPIAHLEDEGLESELDEAARLQIDYVRSAPREPIDLP